MSAGDGETGSSTEAETGDGERGRSPACELLAIFTGPAADELDRRLSELRS